MCVGAAALVCAIQRTHHDTRLLFRKMPCCGDLETVRPHDAHVSRVCHDLVLVGHHAPALLARNATSPSASSSLPSRNRANPRAKFARVSSRLAKSGEILVAM